MSAIPERLIGFKCYWNGLELMGITDVELPSFENMVETVKGAGLLGETETPTKGQFSAMSMKINWRTVVKDLTPLMMPMGHLLEFRGSLQRTDSRTGLLTTEQLRVVVRGKPKSMNLGKSEVAAAMETGSEFTVEYIHVFLGGIPTFEYDPFNYVFRIAGVDQLADVKGDIN